MAKGHTDQQPILCVKLSIFSARENGVNTVFYGKKYCILRTGIGDLCITPWNGLHELFGVPIWAKRTAHASGQIANCLRPLGRVFAI